MPSCYGALFAALLPLSAAAPGPDFNMGLHSSKEFVRFSAGDPRQAPTLILSATGVEDLSQMAQDKLRELEQYAQDALLAKVLHARQQLNQTRDDLTTVADEVAAQLRARTAALEKKWEQLAVASSHGQVGKCCCLAYSLCSWEAFRAGADKECPVGLQDYRDRVKPGAKGLVTSDAIDILLAQCVSSAGWGSSLGAPAGQPATASSTTKEEVEPPPLPSTTVEEEVHLPHSTSADMEAVPLPHTPDPTMALAGPLGSVMADPLLPELELPSTSEPEPGVRPPPLVPIDEPEEPPAGVEPGPASTSEPLGDQRPEAADGGAEPVAAEPEEVAPAVDATSSTLLLVPGLPVDEVTRSPTTFSPTPPAEKTPPTTSTAEQGEQEPEASTSAPQQPATSAAAPAAVNGAGCSDGPVFFDESGEPCQSWVGRDCRQAVEEHGFSQDGEDDLIDSCPESCGLCAQAESQPVSEVPEPCDCDGEDLVHVTISAVLTPTGAPTSAGSLAQRRQSGCTCSGGRHAGLTRHNEGRGGGMA